MSKHRRPAHGSRRTGLAAAALGVAVLTTLGASAPAMAAKGGGGGKSPHGGGSTTSSSLRVVPLDSTDGVPHWSQHMTFEVTTAATDRPFVGLQCFQGGARVYSMSAGFFADYPFTKTYTLSSSYWTGGAADCTATLYHVTTNGHEVVDGTLAFTVQA